MRGWTSVWLVAVLATCLFACDGKDDPKNHGGAGGTGGVGGTGGINAGCGEGCDPGFVCVEDTCVPDTDTDGVPDSADKCPETPAGEEVNREGCSLAQAVIPWNEGPYGIGIRDIAGDFTVNTLDGPWNFRESWTGAGSYLFLLKYDQYEYALGYWNSDVKRFLEETPLGTHLVLLSYDDPSADMAAMKIRIEDALATMDPSTAASWRGNVHYVVDPINAMGGSIGQFFAAKPSFHFAIDRFQRWREVGSLLSDITTATGDPDFRFLGTESIYFNYERRLAWTMDALGATEVVVSDGGRHVGSWDTGTRLEAQFPSAAEMAGFDSMAVYLYTACPNHLQGKDAGCNEWDYAHHLMLCDADDDTNCTTELVRYVTPYGREGEWLTDVSPLLPLLKDGGRRVFQYEGGNGYDLYLKVLLWNEGKPFRPVEARFLWGDAPRATKWNNDYNPAQEPVTFSVDDPSAVRVEMYASITGHGFGDQLNYNCAEFCNHQHEFSLNGTTFLREHSHLGTSNGQRYGCYDRVSEGVVPNQFGTWPYGRAGWCPGEEVKPWVQDISTAVVSGENTLSYRALFRGEPYHPKVTDSGNTTPELRVASWVVFYAPAN